MASSSIFGNDLIEPLQTGQQPVWECDPHWQIQETCFVFHLSVSFYFNYIWLLYLGFHQEAH